MNYENRITPEWINDLKDGEVFVFGSNLSGIHGGGADHIARMNFGAIMGNGIGIQGKSYAIPTKDRNIQTMRIDEIKPFVDKFIDWAKYHSGNVFLVTPIGTGLAGIPFEEIAPLFKSAIEVDNINLPEQFFKIILNLS